jgi:hypothetical protein
MARGIGPALSDAPERDDRFFFFMIFHLQFEAASKALLQ